MAEAAGNTHWNYYNFLVEIWIDIPGRCQMIYYRVALRGSQSSTWRCKSSPLTSLHPVLGWLQLYRSLPKEQIRVFLSSSPEQMDVMLARANQGVLSTAITVEQLWDRHRTSEIEVRRLEIELGSGSDHDAPYTWNVPVSGS
jgi:hypothetical protein